MDTDENGRKYVQFIPSAVTIGVELEMIISNLPDRKNHFELIRNALAPVANELNSQDIFFTHSSNTQNPQLFEIKDDFSITPGPQLPLGKRLEIATPIMRASRSYHTYRTTIPKMCTAITSAMAMTGDSPPPTIEFNPTTALQVHVGVGAGNTYLLSDLKRICKAIIIFESHLDTLHPPCRNPHDTAEPNFLHSCCSSFKLKLLSDVKKLEAIDRQKSTQSLVMVINSSINIKDLPRCYKYNFRSLEKFGTIEFRQAFGTVKAEVIVEWVGTVVKFINAAVETEDSMYEEWARDKGEIRGEDYERFGAPLASKHSDVNTYWGCKDVAES